MSKLTPGGIARPQTGPFTTYAYAVAYAKSSNQHRGRGYRAIKALDGTFAVIFRPAVAGNRQRRVRTVAL